MDELNQLETVPEEPTEEETVSEEMVSKEQGLEEVGVESAGALEEGTPPAEESAEQTGLEEEGTQYEDAAAVEQIASQPPVAEKPKNKFWRRVLWITVGLVVAALIGAGLTYNFLYMPMKTAWQDASAQVNVANTKIESLQTELSDAQAQVDDLEAQISTLEEENEVAYDARMESETHVILLRVLSDVYAARQALEAEESHTARLFLLRAGKKIPQLGEYLSNNFDVMPQDMANLKTRVTLILNGMESDPETALLDLDILVNSLSQLENAYFAVP